MNNQTDSYQTQIASACILLSVADADEILEDNIWSRKYNRNVTKIRERST